MPAKKMPVFLADGVKRLAFPLDGEKTFCLSCGLAFRTDRVMADDSVLSGEST